MGAGKVRTETPLHTILVFILGLGLYTGEHRLTILLLVFFSVYDPVFVCIAVA